MSLVRKISLAVYGVLALAVVSSVVAIGSAFRFEALQRTIVDEHLPSVRAAEELEIALLEQRGYVSLYILDDGNRQWLDRLEIYGKDFSLWLHRARETARSENERAILAQLEDVQRRYASKRDEAVTLYDNGDMEAAKQILLTDVFALYQDAYQLCEAFIVENTQLVDNASGTVRRSVQRITFIALSTLFITLALGMILLWLFFQGIIIPVKRIAADVRHAVGHAPTRDIDQTDALPDLKRYLQLLMSDVAETRSDLEHSRLQLAHADRLAAVGKLAATVAHEIRNPLTSIKMWLYSLRRAVGQDDEALKKLDVVSDEIARLETVVHHFLEFSRPPKLDLQTRSLVSEVDGTLHLLQHRLRDQEIQLIRHDEPNLAEIQIDPEQFRQVLLNLINNALDSMPDGGTIRVACSQVVHGGREMLAVTIADTGCGISGDVRQRLFEPFYTTKDEGTGLGLCISASILARHGGLLELESSDAGGTQCTVRLPIASDPVTTTKGALA